MSTIVSYFEALGGTSLPLALALAAGLALLSLLFRATRAHISQYSFQLTGGWQTFFIKNFDSIRYDSPLLVDVHAERLEQVIVQAGPACQRDPEQIAGGAVRIAFMEVPADASFVIRARSDGGPIKLAIPSASPLKSRSFHRPMVPATVARARVRYALRYVTGAIMMLVVFCFGLYWNQDETWPADFALMGAAFVLSFASFLLVAPLEGKSIVAGYVAWGDSGRSWSREPVVESAELRVPLRATPAEGVLRT